MSAPTEDDFSEDLRCPVCLEVRHDCKIFQCGNGHLICELCHSSVTQCPICRVTLPKPGSRNLFAEKAIRNLPQPCKNAHKGCPFATKDSKAFDAHSSACHFEQVPCPLCFRECHIGTLFPHVELAHGSIDNKVSKEFDGYFRVGVTKSMAGAFPTAVILKQIHCIVILDNQQSSAGGGFIVLPYSYAAQGHDGSKLLVSLEGETAMFSVVTTLMSGKDASIRGSKMAIEKGEVPSVTLYQLLQARREDDSFRLSFKECTYGWQTKLRRSTP